MSAENDWTVRVGEQEYRAENFEMLRQWLTDHRVPDTALVYNHSLGAWTTAAQLIRDHGRPAGTARKRNRILLALALSPVVAIGGCVACTVMMGTTQLIHEATIESKLPGDFKRAEASLRANRYADARRQYEAIIEELSSTTLYKEKARAKAGVGASLALLGDMGGAQHAFVEAINAHDSVQAPSDAGVVMTALLEARNQVESEQAERAARRAERKQNVQMSEMKSRVEGTARRYIEHETAGGVEITSVGDPYMNGGELCVQVYYVADDYRGKRAKVTVVRFNPMNYEVIGSSDVL
jgi:hypothetical protein